MILYNIFLLKFESIMHHVNTQYYEARLQNQTSTCCKLNVLTFVIVSLNILEILPTGLVLGLL